MRGEQNAHEGLLELNATTIDAIRHNDVGWFGDQMGRTSYAPTPTAPRPPSTPS